MSYTIHTKNSGTISSRGDLGDPKTPQVGESLQFEFLIDGGNTPDVINAFIEWANQYNTLTMIDGTRKYMDRTPASAVIDTPLIGIEPDAGLQSQGVNGVWGLVETFEDARDATLSQGRYNVSVFVLAEYGDYVDHGAVETDLQI